MEDADVPEMCGLLACYPNAVLDSPIKQEANHPLTGAPLRLGRAWRLRWRGLLLHVLRAGHDGDGAPQRREDAGEADAAQALRLALRLPRAHLRGSRGRW